MLNSLVTMKGKKLPRTSNKSLAKRIWLIFKEDNKRWSTRMSWSLEAIKTNLSLTFRKRENPNWMKNLRRFKNEKRTWGSTTTWMSANVNYRIGTPLFAALRITTWRFSILPKKRLCSPTKNKDWNMLKRWSSNFRNEILLKEKMPPKIKFWETETSTFSNINKGWLKS